MAVPLKTEPSTILADDGMQIERKEKQFRKTIGSIRFNCDPSSKVTDRKA
jgi:hypothetical protein